MVTWERRYIRKQLSQSSDAQTYNELLGRSGILSALLVKVAATNGATGGGGQDVVDVVSKIEVIGNGSDVIYSLSGIEIAKWNYAWNKRRMSQHRTDLNGAVPFAIFPVLFGRNIGDEELYLDLAQWNSIELKITYAHTAGATLFVTGSVMIDIIGIFCAGGVLPAGRKGYLRTLQIKSTAGAAAGDDEVILSRRYKYTNILVYAFKTATAEGGVISDVELRVNNGALKPYIGRWVDLQEQNDQELGNDPTETFELKHTSGDTIETRSGRIEDADIETVIAAAVAVSYPLYSVAAFTGGTVTLGGVLVAGSAVAGTVDTVLRRLFLRSRGIGIGNAVLLPFARNWNLDECLNAPTMDDLRLVLTQAAASSAVRVSTQELVPA